MELNIDKKYIYIAIIVIIFLFLVMAGSCSEEEVKKVEKDEKQDRTVVFDDDIEVKKIDFKQFKVGSGKPDIPENKLDHDVDQAMPLKMQKILSLITVHKFREAEAMILQLEQRASDSEMTYLIYYKALIYYKSGDLSLAKVFFKEFVRMYPDHRLSRNARNALENIRGRGY